jgi:hypothetical protein
MSEDAAALRSKNSLPGASDVAGARDLPPVPPGPRPPHPDPDLAEVIAIRRAARAVKRSDLAEEGKAWALARLVVRAGSAALPSWALEAIRREWNAPPAADPAALSVLGRLRALQRGGYARCPTCSRLVPDERALAHLDRLERDILAERRRFEGAV